MVNTVINFIINKHEYIELKFLYKLTDLFRFREVVITFKNAEHKNYVLYKDDFIIDALLSLQSYLGRAIAHSAELDDSIIPGTIKQDIGYLWNIYLHYFSDPFQQNQAIGSSLVFKNESWVGLKYLVWDSTGELYDTWIYNKKGAIFLEITPSYKWHSIEPKVNESFISFDSFLERYKPCILTKLSKEVAQEWLQQISELLSIIEANDPKYLQCS